LQGLLAPGQLGSDIVDVDTHAGLNRHPINADGLSRRLRGAGIKRGFQLGSPRLKYRYLFRYRSVRHAYISGDSGGIVNRLNWQIAIAWHETGL
jgi:hypothetical protein